MALKDSDSERAIRELVEQTKDDVRQIAAELRGDQPGRTDVSEREYLDYVRERLAPGYDHTGAPYVQRYPQLPPDVAFRTYLGDRHGPMKALEVATQAMGLPKPSWIKREAEREQK